MKKAPALPVPHYRRRFQAQSLMASHRQIARRFRSNIERGRAGLPINCPFAARVLAADVVQHMEV